MVRKGSRRHSGSWCCPSVGHRRRGNRSGTATALTTGTSGYRCWCFPPVPDEPGPTLGPWLRDHLQSRRNAVRFLLPRAGSTDLFRDRDLLILARAVVLAGRWRTQAPEYRRLQVKYERELRDILSKRFDRFAILDTWDYREPVRCTFHVESHKAQGAKIPEAVDEHIRTNLFIPEEFEALVRAAADNNESVGKLLRELQEPRPAGECCIPWLGETPMKERIIRSVRARRDRHQRARHGASPGSGAGETEEAAWIRMRGKLGTGKHLDETYVLRPQAAPHATGGSGAGASPQPAGSLFETLPTATTRSRREVTRTRLAGRRLLLRTNRAASSAARPSSYRTPRGPRRR